MAHKKNPQKKAIARRDKKAAALAAEPYETATALENTAPGTSTTAPTASKSKAAATSVAEAPQPSRLPSVFALTKRSGQILVHNKKLFLGMTTVYLVLTLLFVQGLGGGNLNASGGQVQRAASVFAYMLSTSGGSSSGQSGVYQTLFMVLMSLAYIWALRARSAGKPVRIRDGFYNGMAPLVPFVLVLLVIALQLLPMILGTAMYTTVMSNHVAGSSGEQVFWLLVLLASVLWTVYMISSSIMGLYIVAEPGMTPKQARKIAKAMSHGRRWAVLGRVLFLPLLLVVGFAIIMLPLLLFAQAAAPWILFFLSLFVLLLVHTYLFSLYKEMRGAQAL